MAWLIKFVADKVLIFAIRNVPSRPETRYPPPQKRPLFPIMRTVMTRRIRHSLASLICLEIRKCWRSHRAIATSENGQKATPPQRENPACGSLLIFLYRPACTVRGGIYRPSHAARNRSRPPLRPTTPRSTRCAGGICRQKALALPGSTKMQRC
jgi:hypothetical protein